MLKAKWTARKRDHSQQSEPATVEVEESVELPERSSGPSQGAVGVQRRHTAQTSSNTQAAPKTNNTHANNEVDRTDMTSYAIPVSVGLAVIAGFFGQSILPVVFSKFTYSSIFCCHTCRTRSSEKSTETTRSLR